MEFGYYCSTIIHLMKMNDKSQDVKITAWNLKSVVAIWNNWRHENVQKKCYCCHACILQYFVLLSQLIYFQIGQRWARIFHLRSCRGLLAGYNIYSLAKTLWRLAIFAWTLWSLSNYIRRKYIFVWISLIETCHLYSRSLNWVRHLCCRCLH